MVDSKHNQSSGSAIFRKRGRPRNDKPPSSLKAFYESGRFRRKSVDESKDEPPCDICGDAGVVDAIVTCSKCKISREHFYCMKKYHEDVPLNWQCEGCESSQSITSIREEEVDLLSSSNWPSSGPRHNWPEKEPRRGGKTRFLWSQEVISMYSGGNANKRNLKFSTRVGSHWVPSKTTRASSSTSGEAGAAHRKTQSITTSLAKSSVMPAGRRSPTNIGEITPKGKNVVTSPAKEHAQRGRTTIGRTTAEAIGTTSTNRQKAIGNTSGASLLSTYWHSPEPPFISGGRASEEVEPKNIDAQNGGIMKFVVTDNISLRTDPALDASWKGSFKLKDEDTCDGILAHPTARVDTKIYQFSMKMPKVLDFELLPLQNFWRDVFHGGCPQKEDIGLYFYPQSERFEKYFSLVERVSEESVMRCRIDRVELLVFSSQILNVDSQKWSKNGFLWGLFRPLKRDIAQNRCDISGGRGNLVIPRGLVGSSNGGNRRARFHDMDFPPPGSGNRRARFHDPSMCNDPRGKDFSSKKKRPRNH